MEGILHVYHPTRGLLLFEHTPQPKAPPTPSPLLDDDAFHPPQNTLLFVGGMFDNFLNPQYTTALGALFPRHLSQAWSLMHVQLSSAGRGFGVSSVSKDAEELATAINYIRTVLRRNNNDNGDGNGGNIVLLGHSTGCQDVLHYLSTSNPSAPNKPTRPAVQGAILQAPVSDRDQATYLCRMNPETKSLHDEAIEISTKTPKSQHLTTLLPLHLTTPLFGPAPLTITRFLSLSSPNSPQFPSPDDLFSHDLEETHLKSTFGNIGSVSLLQPTLNPKKPSLLVLMSGSDEYVPSTVDKAALLTRWRTSMRGSGCTLHGASAIIDGGNHALDTEGDEAGVSARMVVFRGAVLDYLDEVVGGVDLGAWEVWGRDRDAVAEGGKGGERDAKL